MFIKQIIEFELKGPRPYLVHGIFLTGCRGYMTKANPKTGYFQDKTKISKENRNLQVNYCCCCGAYLSSCHQTASDANLLDDPHTFHYQDYFVIGGIRTCLGVSDDLMFLWISSNSCPLNLLLVRSHQAEIIIIKRLIQGRNSVTRVRVEPRSLDQGRRKNDAFTYSATLLTTLPATLLITSKHIAEGNVPIACFPSPGSRQLKINPFILPL